MKKICIFVHYSSQPSIPYYVCAYVNELSKYFDEILIVTNKREIPNPSSIVSDKIKLLQVKNEGYDLGMFFKAFETLNVEKFQQIACINDSNILLNNLEFLFKWSESRSLDMWGLMDSYEKVSYSTHQNNYHIQSHFLVFNRSSFSTLKAYFKDLDLQRIIKTDDLQQVKKLVINDWEIGVSQYLLKKGNKIGAYYHREDYINQRFQPHIEMLIDGMPTIKKKIITSVKPRDLFAGKNYWSKLVKKYAKEVVQPDKLLPDLKRIRRIYLQNAAKRLL